MKRLVYIAMVRLMIYVINMIAELTCGRHFSKRHERDGRSFNGYSMPYTCWWELYLCFQSEPSRNSLVSQSWVVFQNSLRLVITDIDNKGQYPDGLRAPMIIHDRNWEASLGYDQEFVFSVSDWYVVNKNA